MPSWRQERSGSTTITAAANGNATIAHGMHSTPASALVGLRGDNVNGIDVESIDATNITVRVKNASGADVTSGTFVVDWNVRAGTAT